MSQEKKTFSESNKIPIFNATGSSDNSYTTLPAFNKTANNSVEMKHMAGMHNQIPNTNYQDRPIKYTTDNRKQNDTLRGLMMVNTKQEAVIDLTGTNVNTGQKLQMSAKQLPTLPRPQLQSNMVPNSLPTGYSNLGNYTNSQFMSQGTKTDPNQARITLDTSGLSKNQNEQIYIPPILLSEQYHTGPMVNQHTTHKVPTEYNQNTTQYQTRHPHNTPYTSPNHYKNNSIQPQLKPTAVPFRDSHTGTAHTGEMTQKNHNMYQVQMQQNPNHFGSYAKEIKFGLKTPYSDNPIQNTNSNGYVGKQQIFQGKQMETKQEMVYERVPNSMQQGRPFVSNDSVLGNNNRITQSMTQSNGLSSKGVQMENKTSYKVNPMLYNKHHQNSMSTTQDPQTILKPMTTPRPTIVPDDTHWQGQVNQFYDFSNTSAITEYQENEVNKLMEEIINNVYVSKYSYNPDAEKQIQQIKNELLMAEVNPYQPGHSMTSAPGANYSYIQSESTARKRPNEAQSPRVEPTKKQTFVSQYPGYIDQLNQNITSPSNYNEPSMYDMNQSYTQQQPFQTQNINFHQSNYQVNSNEMNQIVPTSSSLHSSPNSNRYHDSPGVDLVAKKRRDDDQDYSTKISDEGTNYW